MQQKSSTNKTTDSGSVKPPEGPEVQTLNDFPAEEVLRQLPLPNDTFDVLQQAMKRPSFITVTYVNSKGALKHWWVTRRFPKDALLPTLNHIKDDVERKELGGSVISTDFRSEIAKRKGKF